MTIPFSQSEFNGIRFLMLIFEVGASNGQMTMTLLVLFSEVTNCEVKNGGCAQTCAMDQRGIQCSCDVGWALHENGRDCVGKNDNDYVTFFFNLLVPVLLYTVVF